MHKCDFFWGLHVYYSCCCTYIRKTQLKDLSFHLSHGTKSAKAMRSQKHPWVISLEPWHFQRHGYSIKFTAVFSVRSLWNRIWWAETINNTQLLNTAIFISLKFTKSGNFVFHTNTWCKRINCTFYESWIYLGKSADVCSVDTCTCTQNTR